MKLGKWLVQRYSVSGNPKMTERRIELFCISLAVILCVQLFYSFVQLQFLSAPDPIVPSSEMLEFANIQAIARVTPAQGDEIVARPLFWPSRLPLGASEMQNAEEGEDSAKENELSKVKLQGVFGGGDTAGIIVLVNNKKRRVILRGGLLGWTLDSVTVDRVMFSRNGQTHELLLEQSFGTATNGSNTK